MCDGYIRDMIWND